VRLFFALWPPREAAGALHEWASKASRLSGGRVTRAGTIHLTLAFLGDIEEERISSLKGAARASAGEAHMLPIEQSGYWKHNRIVWAGPKETPAALESLAVDLKNRLLESGFTLEARPFAAHVTLARNAREPRELPELPEIEWPVSEFVLVRSTTAPEGARYETLERFALRGGARPGRK
jgi:RNA 2',3'-cyclic 3'-phosphodiesterase